MSIYLKAKHWQLFIVLVGSMFLVQAFIFNSVMSGVVPSPLLLVLPTLLIGVLFFGWLWSIASACYKTLPSELATSPKIMKLGLVYSIVYLAVSGFFFFNINSQPSSLIIIPHFLAMAAVIYALGFTAKQLTKLEQGQNITFFSYSGPFFLFWFFPIGIWFIQPKVNQLLGGNNA